MCKLDNKLTFLFQVQLLVSYIIYIYFFSGETSQMLALLQIIPNPWRFKKPHVCSYWNLAI